MTKLSQTQIALLNAAAASESGFIDRPGDGGRAPGALIKKGLMISIPQDAGPSRLMMTAAGRQALGLDMDAAPNVGDAGKASLPEGPTASLPPTRDGSTKIQALVGLLQRERGATIADMMGATGWQAHSVRGAISGSVKKALGLEVVSEKVQGVRTYRVVQATGA